MYLRINFLYIPPSTGWKIMWAKIKQRIIGKLILIFIINNHNFGMKQIIIHLSRNTFQMIKWALGEIKNRFPEWFLKNDAWSHIDTEMRMFYVFVSRKNYSKIFT